MRLIFVTILGLVAIASTARADLVVSPANGEQLFRAEFAAAAVGDTVDDVAELRQLGLSQFRLFGNSVTELWVSDNGNLNSDNNVAFFPDPIGTTNPTVDMIAPMWDDILLLKLPSGYTPGNSVIENRLANVFYSVTWQNARLFNETILGGEFPDTVRSMQAVLFGGELLMNGFQFQPNDIVFSYVSFNGKTSAFVDEVVESVLPQGNSQLNAAIGLASRSGGSVRLFGDTNDSGFIEADEASVSLPWTNGEFVLFRERLDGAGEFSHYNVSTERFIVAVPEPSALLLCMTCLLAFARIRPVRHCHEESLFAQRAS